MGLERTQATLVRDLKALGLRDGDLVMLHVSYRALGPVDGGPDALIDALLEVVGSSGGLVMFVSWAHSTYDAFLTGGLSDEERANWPAYDAQTAALREGYGGAVGSCLAARADSKRSANPDRSLLAIGAAKPLLDAQPLSHGFGPGSPLQSLYEKGGRTLNIGAPLYTATILHYAEYLCGVPNKRYVRYQVPILEDGVAVWREVEQMNREAFVQGAEGLDPDYLEQVIRAYLATGRHREGEIGAAKSYLYDMSDLVPFAVRYFEERFG